MCRHTQNDFSLHPYFDYLSAKIAFYIEYNCEIAINFIHLQLKTTICDEACDND